MFRVCFPGPVRLVSACSMTLPNFRRSEVKTHLPAAFSIAGFWLVVKKLSKKGGRKVLTGALTLYYCMRDSETPKWAKTVIVGALGYLIFPMDFIPDAIPGVGFTDDWSVILGAITTVAAHIKESHKRQAADLAERIMGGEMSGEPPALRVPHSHG